jgi:hypothetical protein
MQIENANLRFLLFSFCCNFQFSICMPFDLALALLPRFGFPFWVRKGFVVKRNCVKRNC